ncbi:unnamed protein product [Notodromas monacha]|uniref:PNT domain-containing protein n=1 Tax=Notodromas monacha TaxID=399045 RepID=A0A7R9BEJ6_9CRUS|nr:unnamed protein product [Notodromas monacha]CAG0912325.1 unnamed protein product [Notodromas monacha]
METDTLAEPGSTASPARPISINCSFPDDLPSQMPPLTPGTNTKMNEALKASYASWDKERERVKVPRDPMQWTDAHVAQWLLWATREFSLEGLQPELLFMPGKDMCALGREKFLSLTPPFMGDILWEHLDILQKESLRQSIFSTLFVVWGITRRLSQYTYVLNGVTSLWGHLSRFSTGHWLLRVLGADRKTRAIAVWSCVGEETRVFLCAEQRQDPTSVRTWTSRTADNKKVN